MTDKQVTRESFLKNGLLAVFGLVAGAQLVASAADEPTVNPQEYPKPEDLVPFRFVQGAPEIPPLDSPIVWAREQLNPQFCTHELLSLVMEERHENSYPWVQYNQLTTSHTGGDAVVFYSRLQKDGPGWSCGNHSEVFSTNWGVGIGVNIEVSNNYEGDEGFNGIYGAVIQGFGKRQPKSGVLITGGLGFENGIELNAKHGTGINLDCETDVGINLHDNRLRLNEGAWLDLDAEGKVRMRYFEGNLEFWNGESRIAHLPMTGEDRAL
jgi:hypothetical protein